MKNHELPQNSFKIPSFFGTSTFRLLLSNSSCFSKIRLFSHFSTLTCLYRAVLTFDRFPFFLNLATKLLALTSLVSLVVLNARLLLSDSLRVCASVSISPSTRSTFVQLSSPFQFSTSAGLWACGRLETESFQTDFSRPLSASKRVDCLD